jgi:diaminopimelate decarboxylase
MENTPYYFYDLNILEDTLQAVSNNIEGHHYAVHYAIKANNNKEILKTIAAKGFGADCVSGWEIEAAMEAGFTPENIVFAGVGKTDEEIRLALTANIGMINCESLEEIQVINEIAEQLGIHPKIALRLNPNVNALTHEKISTGLAENKFGLTVLEFNELLTQLDVLTSVDIVGLHFHIGSQIMDMSVFATLCARIMQIVPEFEAKIGPLSYLNVGGGLGIDYNNPDLNSIPDFQRYFNTFKAGLVQLSGVPVHFELGRSIVAQCGSLHTKVLYVKRSENKNFAIMDAGMTELMRPALYGAEHKIEKLNCHPSDSAMYYDVVGPICESSDCFGKDIRLPELKRGDIVTIRSCGAYAESMSLRYNGREAIGNNLKPQVHTALRILKYA